MKLLTGTIMRYRIPYFGCWIEPDIELDAQSLLNAKKKKDTNATLSTDVQRSEARTLKTPSSPADTEQKRVAKKERARDLKPTMMEMILIEHLQSFL